MTPEDRYYANSDEGNIKALRLERRRLAEQVRIATDALEAIAACDRKAGGERYPGACATAAHDALIQMSVVD